MKELTESEMEVYWENSRKIYDRPADADERPAMKALNDSAAISALYGATKRRDTEQVKKIIERALRGL